MSRTLRQRLAVVLMAAVAVGCFGTAPVVAQISGAIFTTNADCDGTNLNLYANKRHVYLDGGPRKPGAAGLPDGEYYVQVTAPNGVLLGTSVGSGDDTPVVVVGGEFVTCYQLWAILIKASNGKEGYDDTPNNGGVYKVWISLTGDFINSESKTDNFKVKNGKPVEQTEIRARKFYDANANGVWDSGEPPLDNWRIQLRLLSDSSLIACDLTDGGGEVRFLVDLDGTDYVVEETLLEPYINSTPESVIVVAAEPVVEVEFGNYCVTPQEGLGRTPGFWQSCNNPNGEGIVGCDLLAACDPDWRTLLNELCLVWPDGSPLVIPAGAFADAFAEIDGWITGTGAEGNMAYILSRQVAALALNRTCGYMTAAVALAEDPYGDIIAVDDIIAAADALLCAYPLSLGSDSDPDVVTARAEQELYKNAIDAINNNLVPVYTVNPTPCPYTPIPCP